MLDRGAAPRGKGEAEIVIGAATGLAGAQDVLGASGSAGADADAAAAAATRRRDRRERARAGAARRRLARSHALPAGRRARRRLQALYTFELARDRYLGDHRIDGRPVLPFAVAMELMAQAALRRRAGTAVSGLREIRLLSGLALQHDQPASVRIDSAPQDGGEIERHDQARRARPPPLSRPGAARRPARPARSARPARPERPGLAARPAPLAELTPFPLTLEGAYRDLLFHGPLFQGIAAIDGMDARGASAVLRASQAAQCVAGAERPRAGCSTR